MKNLSVVYLDEPTSSRRKNLGIAATIGIAAGVVVLLMILLSAMAIICCREKGPKRSTIFQVAIAFKSKYLKSPFDMKYIC